MPDEKYISDKRILQLARILKQEGEVRFEKHFFDEVGISKQSVNNVRNHGQHFTARQIENICKKYKINANWIYGFRNEEIFRKPEKSQREEENLKVKNSRSELPTVNRNIAK